MNRQDIEQYKKVRADFDKMNGDIAERVDEVISAIHNAFGVSRKGNWWFEDAEEGGVGFPTIPEDETHELTVYNDFPNNISTDVWDYHDGFPFFFLFLSDEEIIEHVKLDIKKTEENKKKKAEKKKKAKSDKNKDKKIALDKLSPKDRKALGV